MLGHNLFSSNATFKKTEKSFVPLFRFNFLDEYLVLHSLRQKDKVLKGILSLRVYNFRDNKIDIPLTYFNLREFLKSF